MSATPLPLLVDTSWLAEHASEPDVRIVDGSWYLPAAKRDPRAEYAEGHIPGAIYLDLSTDLADESAPVRNTIASPEALAERLGRAGISGSHSVVFYDHMGGASAARLWWMMTYLGHAQAALLDGGIEKWKADGHAVTTEPGAYPPTQYRPGIRPDWLCFKDDVLGAIESGNAQIIDAREETRFRGEGPEPAKYKGHMPGARCVPYTENLTGTPPRLKTAQALREHYQAAGIDFERPVITTCGSGVTASLCAFALQLAGHQHISVYDGSWAEWGNIDGLPVESGSAAPE